MYLCMHIYMIMLMLMMTVVIYDHGNNNDGYSDGNDDLNVTDDND